MNFRSPRWGGFAGRPTAPPRHSSKVPRVPRKSRSWRRRFSDRELPMAATGSVKGRRNRACIHRFRRQVSARVTPGARDCYYFFSASFAPPTAFWILPSTFSILPALVSLASPSALPVASFTLPATCFAAPSMRSLFIVESSFEWSYSVEICSSRKRSSRGWRVGTDYQIPLTDRQRGLPQVARWIRRRGATPVRTLPHEPCSDGLWGAVVLLRGHRRPAAATIPSPGLEVCRGARSRPASRALTLEGRPWRNSDRGATERAMRSRRRGGAQADAYRRAAATRYADATTCRRSPSIRRWERA
jgi:hypothetical protein